MNVETNEKDREKAWKDIATMLGKYARKNKISLGSMYALISTMPTMMQKKFQPFMKAYNG
jgi:hypothetical protein